MNYLAVQFAGSDLESYDEGTTLTATIYGDSLLQGDAYARAREMLDRVSKHKNNAGLKLGRFLGEGGMGVVRSARQIELGRDVAVKMLRSDLKDMDAAIVSMLREAWVTGTLEHPNIVPVHFVDIDAWGKPQIVLKRIEGKPWSALMSDEKAVLEEYGTDDLLGWNLGILDKVINAVRYAHSRGIVHRDLKPENVMVGSFGEVYLVDWGIAVSLQDDGETLLPIASDLGDEKVVGTPGYMAPEMLGDAVDARCDIYLLGAILYRIIVGRPPHKGPGLETLVESIRQSKPVFPDNVPVELSEICRKAMQVSPADRFEDAESLNRALVAYSGHRVSLDLSKRAQEHLQNLNVKIEEIESIGSLQETLGQCKFGFQSALEAWPENEYAQDGLRESIELVSEVLFLRGKPRAALNLLQELKNPCLELLGEIKSAVQDLDNTELELERLGSRENKEMGKGLRLSLLLVFAFGWVVCEFFAYLLGTSTNASHTVMMTTTVVYMVALLGLLYWGRHTLMETNVNRQFGAILVTILLGQFFAVLSGQLIGISSEQVFVVWMLLWCVIGFIATATIDYRIWPTALAIVASLLLTSMYMEFRVHSMLGFSIVAYVNGVIIWGPREKS